MMTVDHLPGNVFGRFSNTEFGPLGFFTAASIFVFLAGVVSAKVYGHTFQSRGTAATWRRVTHRAWQLYLVNLLILSLLAAGITLQVLAGPFWVQEFGLFYRKPASAVIQGLLLLYRPGFADILPMYVLFLVMVPLILLASRAGYRWAVLAVSVGIWLVAQGFVQHGALNPFAYQLLFVVGFLSGSIQDLDRLRQQRWVVALARLATPVVLAAIALRLAYGLDADVHAALEPWRVWAGIDNNGLVRVVNFLLFAFVAAYGWPRLVQPLQGRAIFRFMEFLGQYALTVFAWSVLATYVSIALMPAEPSMGWHLLDLVLTISSLAVPAVAHAVLAGKLRLRPVSPEATGR